MSDFLLTPSNALTGQNLLRRRHADGTWSFARCKDRCCDPGAPAFFYAARRCDTVTPPPIPLPIPETVPTVILIPGPWGCPGEPCEIAGKRLVLYGGYCYVIDEEQPEAFQNPPCGEHLKPRRYLPGHFDPQPPIVDPAQLTCKPLGELCSSDCIPQAPPGSCCTATNCTDPPPEWPSDCYPCDCPVFHRYALLFQWNESRQHRTSQDCLPEWSGQSSGSGSMVFDCDTPETPILNGTMSRTCSNVSAEFCGPTRCEDVGEPYTGPITTPVVTQGFGNNPATAISNLFSRDLFCSGFCGGHVVPDPSNAQPCVGTDIQGGFPQALQITRVWAMIANCFGGQYTGNFETKVVATGCVVCEGTATIAWTWVPLERCPDDPNPILDVPEAYRPGVRKALNKVNRPARMSFRDVFRLIMGGT